MIGDILRDVCTECGVAEVAADDVYLAVFDRLPKQNFYSFDCPDCGAHNRKAAPPRVVATLETVVKKHTVKIPDEFLQAQKMKGAPINEADVDAFVAQLHG